MLYSTGIGIFIICFIIEKASGFFSRIMGKICCCCLYRDTQPATFSNDLFNDIAKDKQAEEYDNAKKQHAKLQQMALKEPESEFKALR